MKRKIIGEYKPIKRGQWKDLTIPIYSKGRIETMRIEKPTEGKEYCVWNRITKDLQYVVALSAQEACEKLGYMIGDCQVKEVVGVIV